jgi:ABC-type multidrug transport system ATPase subunit
MSTMLEVKNLSKKFKNIQAVNNLSFTVNQGDVYGFLGQNGAGKSTTLRILLTLIKEDSGEINFFGKNLKKNRIEVLKQTGAVIERPDLYKYLSAYDNLSIFGKMSKVRISRKLIMDQLAMVGLEDRAHDKVKAYSQGMKQRLGIATALIHDPKLIILDEPTNGLDPQGIADMRRLIISLSKEMGKTVIVSSHLLNEIEQIANRMIIIHKGKKVVEGVVSELLDPGKTIVTFETTDNRLAVERLKETKWNGMSEDADGFLRLQMNKVEIPLLVNTLSENGVGILSVQPRHSLEDYFLSLTNTEHYVEPAADRTI